MAKGKRIPIRVTNEEDDAFREAAAIEGLDVSKWMRALAHRRIREQQDAATVQLTAGFIPGFGFDPDDDEED